jgi:nucleoside-diphosphate-sugar epimerase
MAHAYHYLYDIDVSVVRYFTVYGPAGRPDLALFRFTQWISEGRPVQVYGDGEQSRGFTYLDDIARGVIQALKPLGFEIINLGGHEVITINNLIALVEEWSAKSRRRVRTGRPGRYALQLGGRPQGGRNPRLGAAVQHAGRDRKAGGVVQRRT